MNILIVEDNPRDADLIRRHLHGHEVTIVDTLKAGWDRLLAAPDRWDLCLLDLHLPDGSGANLLARIRLHRLPIAVVVLTGRADMGLTVILLREGANDYLVKDVETFANLGATVAEARARFLAESQRRRIHIKVLYADSDSQFGEAIRTHVRAAAPHLSLACVSTASAVLDMLRGSAHGVESVVIDLRLPDINGMDLLKTLRQEVGFTAPIIIASHPESESIAVQAMRLGANEWISKQDQFPDRLIHAVESSHAHHLLDRQNRELHEALARYRAIIDQTPDHFLTCSAAFIITGANRRLRAAMGWELVPDGASLSVLVHPLDQARLDHLVGRMNPDGNPCSMSIRMVVGGDVGWYEWRVCPIVDRNRRFLEYQIFARSTSGYDDPLHGHKSIGRIWKEHEELQDFCRRARTTAHDVNNLLTIAMSGTDQLREIVPREERIDRILDRVSTATRRSGGLLRQLQDDGYGSLSGRGASTLLSAAFADLVDLVRPALPARIGMSQQIPAEELWVAMDPEHLSRVLLNLVTNAKDALPASGSISLRAVRAESGKEAVIEVEDDGVGIPPDLLPRIFDPHVTTKAHGSGLGLASCRRMVTACGGSITAASEPGQGTVMRIHLPLAPAPAASDRA